MVNSTSKLNEAIPDYATEFARYFTGTVANHIMSGGKNIRQFGHFLASPVGNHSRLKSKMISTMLNI